MAAPVDNWLRSRGYEVRREFSTSVGICDLAGCRFDSNRLRERIDLSKKRSLGTQFRISVWLALPPLHWRRPAKLDELASRFGDLVSIDEIRAALAKLEKDGFVVRSSSGRYCRQGGWFPVHSQLIAIELKLNRVKQAFCQAASYQGFATESYVGLPWDVAMRASDKYTKMFKDKGIGLLAVRATRVQVVIAASERAPGLAPLQIVEAHAAERFLSSSLQAN